MSSIDDNKPSTFYVEGRLSNDDSRLEDASEKDLKRVNVRHHGDSKLAAVDEANEYLGEDEVIEIDPEEERKLVRKIDYTIIPIIGVCYIFFYIDKTSLSYAAIFGLKTDLELSGSQYSWLSSIFYFGFLAFSFPTNYMLLRFPVNRYLGINIFAWGAFLLIQAATSSFGGLAAVRFLGGMGEACADAAFLLITSMYYTKKEQPWAISKFYCFNGVGIALGGLIGYGLGSINGALPSWKYEFIVIGTLCSAWGIVTFFFLPANPMRAKWFSDYEKKIIAYRLKKDQTGMETKVWKWYQVKECFMDVKTYLFFLSAFFGNLPNGGFSNFGTMIVNGMGYSTLPTTLLQIPYGCYITLSIITAAFLNNYFNNKLQKNTRIVIFICFIIPNIAATFGLYFTPEDKKIGRLFCYYFTGTYNASFVLMLSINTSNTAGHTKKVLTNASLFLGYCIGNIAGPFFYKQSQYPRYSLGIGSCIFSHCMQIILILALGFFLRRENRRRDALQQGEVTINHGLEDLTDRENLNFRYVY